MADSAGYSRVTQLIRSCQPVECDSSTHLFTQPVLLRENEEMFLKSGQGGGGMGSPKLG